MLYHAECGMVRVGCMLKARGARESTATEQRAPALCTGEKQMPATTRAKKKTNATLA